MALLQLHLPFPINTWLQYIAQRQLQAQTRNICVFGFGAVYIRDHKVRIFSAKLMGYLHSSPRLYQIGSAWGVSAVGFVDSQKQNLDVQVTALYFIYRYPISISNYRSIFGMYFMKSSTFPQDTHSELNWIAWIES